MIAGKVFHLSGDLHCNLHLKTMTETERKKWCTFKARHLVEYFANTMRHNQHWMMKRWIPSVFMSTWKTWKGTNLESKRTRENDRLRMSPIQMIQRQKLINCTEISVNSQESLTRIYLDTLRNSKRKMCCDAILFLCHIFFFICVSKSRC